MDGSDVDQTESDYAPIGKKKDTVNKTRNNKSGLLKEKAKEAKDKNNKKK